MTTTRILHSAWPAPAVASTIVDKPGNKNLFNQRSPTACVGRELVSQLVLRSGGDRHKAGPNGLHLQGHFADVLIL